MSSFDYSITRWGAESEGMATQWGAMTHLEWCHMEADRINAAKREAGSPLRVEVQRRINEKDNNAHECRIGFDQ